MTKTYTNMCNTTIYHWVSLYFTLNFLNYDLHN